MGSEITASILKWPRNNTLAITLPVPTYMCLMRRHPMQIKLHRAVDMHGAFLFDADGGGFSAYASEEKAAKIRYCRAVCRPQFRIDSGMAGKKLGARPTRCSATVERIVLNYDACGSRRMAVETVRGAKKRLGLPRYLCRPLYEAEPEKNLYRRGSTA